MRNGLGEDRKLLGLAEFYYYWDADRQAGRGAGRLCGWVGSSHDDDDGVMLIKCV